MYLETILEKIFYGFIFLLIGTFLAVIVALFDYVLNPLTKTSPTLAESHHRFLPSQTVNLQYYIPIKTREMVTCRDNSATIYQSTINLTEQIVVCD